MLFLVCLGVLGGGPDAVTAQPWSLVRTDKVAANYVDVRVLFRGRQIGEIYLHAGTYNDMRRGLAELARPRPDWQDRDVRTLILTLADALEADRSLRWPLKNFLGVLPVNDPLWQRVEEAARHFEKERN